jgi:hypothetical protein
MTPCLENRIVEAKKMTLYAFRNLMWPDREKGETEKEERVGYMVVHPDFPSQWYEKEEFEAGSRPLTLSEKGFLGQTPIYPSNSLFDWHYYVFTQVVQLEYREGRIVADGIEEDGYYVYDSYDRCMWISVNKAHNYYRPITSFEYNMMYYFFSLNE